MSNIINESMNIFNRSRNRYRKRNNFRKISQRSISCFRKSKIITNKRNKISSFALKRDNVFDLTCDLVLFKFNRNVFNHKYKSMNFKFKKGSYYE